MLSLLSSVCLGFAAASIGLGVVLAVAWMQRPLTEEHRLMGRLSQAGFGAGILWGIIYLCFSGLDWLLS